MQLHKSLIATAVLTISGTASSAPWLTTEPINIQGNPGSVHISQCNSAFQSCDNAEMVINLNGDGNNTINVNGKSTVIKGTDGKDGKNGRDGKDGRNGIDGKDGAKGEQGVAGKDGTNGLNGRDGTDGRNGVDGKDGARGEKGEAGAAGRDGVNGIDGKDGAKGERGEKGDQGIQGVKGDKGDTGAAGRDGQDGAKGDKGDRGTDGINGTNGLDGHDGIDGKDGINGTDGLDGRDGTNGVDGAKGDKGEKGDTGLAGRDGVDGINGKDGKDADMSVVNGKVDKIDYEANTKEQDDKIEANTESLIKETEQREAQHITLVTQVNQIGATGDYAVYQAGLANEAVAANRVALESTNARIAHNTTLLNKHTVQISALEHNMNSRFSVLDNKINDNRKRASAAISGVAAMANIPQVTDTQRFTVGAGVGTTDSESALAVGFSARATESVVIKASVSTDTQSNFVVGAGASYGW